MYKKLLAGVPVVTFVVGALWGMLAMQPYAPKPHEGMMWIPTTVTVCSMAMAWIGAVMVDQAWTTSKKGTRHNSVFSASSLMFALVAVLVVAITWTGWNEVSGPVVLLVGLALSLFSSATSLVAAARHRARIPSTIFAMLLQATIILSVASLAGRAQPEAGRISGSWFTASTLVLGLSALAAAGYWQAMLRDPSISFSLMLRSIVRLLASNMPVEEWCTKNLLHGGVPHGKRRKTPSRRRRERRGRR
ncbi:hypothetical protein NMB32_17250 [Stenotrophomonas sp. CD2]|nr:hypothetical protein NMB32_17250 [Stenotrophomonas sp. CD2]